MPFGKRTTIVNLGYLPGHVRLKTTLLNAAGWDNVVTIVLEPPTEWDSSKIMDLLAARAPDALLLAGGAMMTEFPEMMGELQTFIAAKCQGVRVVITTKADFDAGIPFPPTEEQVGKSALTICTRLLAEAAGQ
jgi:hypothetical protein